MADICSPELACSCTGALLLLGRRDPRVGRECCQRRYCWFRRAENNADNRIAQLFYPKDFKIAGNSGLIGLLNSAPYLMCIVSCLWVDGFNAFVETRMSTLDGATTQGSFWASSITVELLLLVESWADRLNSLTEPLNRFYGRRGAIMVCCVFCFASCLGQVFCRNWQQLLACRLLLGFGVGPKSATIPIYAAESVPSEEIRGALVMTWQLYTALGIMLGYAMTYAFRDLVRQSTVNLASI